MIITLNITEDSKVELVKDNCEAVQGENNVTVLNINYPSTIKGYSIDNYTKQIEFGECKELGECKKFFDVVEGNTYELCSTCTQFKKLMIQFTLINTVDEQEPIVWKTIPFALEFCESINAEHTKEAQVALLSLAEIKTEWENYVKNNTLRMVYKVGDVPTANATSLGDTIFYLGATATSPYTLTYGHYYRCNYVNGVYEWTDLTQDPSLEDVANGIREINNNQTTQLWVGTKEELENEVIQENVMYIPEDLSMVDTFNEVLSEMTDNNAVLKLDNETIIPTKKCVREISLICETTAQSFELEDTLLYLKLKAGGTFEIRGYLQADNFTTEGFVKHDIKCKFIVGQHGEGLSTLSDIYKCRVYNLINENLELADIYLYVDKIVTTETGGRIFFGVKSIDGTTLTMTGNTKLILSKLYKVVE